MVRSGQLGRRCLLAATLGVAGALAMPSVGCGDAAFACVTDAECLDGNVGGRCEESGYCSFDDPRCPGGRRYGEHAGDGFGGDCVGATSGPTTAATKSTSEPFDDGATAGSVDTVEPPEFDAYGPCEVSSECEASRAACVTNGANRMCAPSCTMAKAPSTECPIAVDGVSEVGCLYTDAAMAEVRCFVLCDATTPCPTGMLCAEPVCTWSEA